MLERWGRGVRALVVGPLIKKTVLQLPLPSTEDDKAGEIANDQIAVSRQLGLIPLSFFNNGFKLISKVILPFAEYDKAKQVSYDPQPAR